MIKILANFFRIYEILIKFAQIIDFPKIWEIYPQAICIID